MPDTGNNGIDDVRLKSRNREDVRARRSDSEPVANQELHEGELQTPSPLGISLQGGRGNRPLRSASIQHAQQLHGNRAVQRYVQRNSAGTGADTTIDDTIQDLDLIARRASVAQIDPPVRTFLERGLGSDLSGVRVHDDNAADQLARSVDALAFTTGQDIFFRSGAYKPGSPQGLRLLAHEATHTVQQARAGLSMGEIGTDARQPGLSVSTRTDPSEVEAETAAERAIAGERSEVRTKPSASLSRFGWSDALDMGAGGIIGEVASAFTGPKPDDTNAAAAGLPPDKKDAGIWDRLKGGWNSEVKQEQQRGNEIDNFRHDAIDNTVDWLEGQTHKGGQMGVESTKDIPVLHQLAQANAAVGDFGADFAGGFIKGAGGLLGSIGQMAANPIGTAKGLWAMSTHIPGMGLPTKIIDKGIDVATGDKKLGDAFDETLGAKAAQDDASFWKNTGAHFLKPYGEAIDKGKYGEVGGRALFDIGSLVLGAGEADAGTAAKVADTADATNAATKALDASGSIPKATATVPLPEAVPPSGVPTVRNPTPVVDPVPSSVPPSKLVPDPGQIHPPVPSVPPGEFPLGPKTEPAPPPSIAPDSNVPTPRLPPDRPPAPPPTDPAPPPPDFLDPKIPKPIEKPGWGERLLEEERKLQEKVANPDYDWFWQEVEKLKR